MKKYTFKLPQGWTVNEGILHSIFENMKGSDEDPMDKFAREDAAYMNAIRCAGAKLHQSDVKCCNNKKNHKKVYLFTSAYKMCTVCKSDLSDWKQQ